MGACEKAYLQWELGLVGWSPAACGRPNEVGCEWLLAPEKSKFTWQDKPGRIQTRFCRLPNLFPSISAILARMHAFVPARPAVNSAVAAVFLAEAPVARARVPREKMSLSLG
jgi:hypothetical protein